MGDSIVIFLLALMLFGPKKLPQLARQLGKLMAEFRKASNDFRMQMEDELRLEEQKEHQAKVDALKPPPSAVDPAELSASNTDPATSTNPDAVAEVQPIAESGELKMMPPTSGLPAESSTRGRSYDERDGTAEVTEQGTGGMQGAATIGAGSSSEEPLDEAAVPLEPPPDRGHPVMAGEGERATHVSTV